MFEKITEGKAIINVPITAKGEVVSRKLPVFYNPIMKFNRDVSIWVLNAVDRKQLQLALPLAGSGVRGIRFLKELKKGIIKEIYVNDVSENAIKLIKNNLKLNKQKTTVSNKDANEFLISSLGFDYIDIDPFGSPNPFLNNAIIRLSRDGILAVTATDTSALSGTYRNACERKYWAKPLRNELMHEVGLRILIRKVQLIAANFDKALTPILSYSKDHYMRIFFKCEKGKTKVDKILKEHAYFNYDNKTMEFEVSKFNSKNYAGPLYIGKLQDKKLLKKILKETDDKFIKLLYDELDIVGFIDLHKVSKIYKVKNPKFENIMNKIKKTNKVSRTHFSKTAIKTDMSLKEVLKCLK